MSASHQRGPRPARDQEQRRAEAAEEIKRINRRDAEKGRGR